MHVTTANFIRENRETMELGISTWSLPWSIGVSGYPRPLRPLDAFGLLAKAVEVNVKIVQIADNLPLLEMPQAELERLCDAARESRLTLEVGTRGLDVEHLRRYLTIAHQPGARFLRTVLSGGLCSKEQLSRAEEDIRRVLPALHQHGITLALENNEAFSAEEFAGLIRRIGDPLVGICLDTANSLGRPETLETVVEHLAEYTVMLHAKDYDIRRIDTRMGFSVVGRPAGEGRVDFDWVLSELQKRGREGVSVIVEHWPPFEGTVAKTVETEQEWLTRSVRFLRSRVPAPSEESG
jgi:sugar phosphate isomerase/epimerase